MGGRTDIALLSRNLSFLYGNLFLYYFLKLILKTLRTGKDLRNNFAFLELSLFYMDFLGFWFSQVSYFLKTYCNIRFRRAWNVIQFRQNLEPEFRCGNATSLSKIGFYSLADDPLTKFWLSFWSFGAVMKELRYGQMGDYCIS